MAIKQTTGQLRTFPGAVTHDALILTSGIVDSRVLAGEIRTAAEQASGALATLLDTVERAGGSISTILRIEAFLAHRGALAAWDEAFVSTWPGQAPTRTTLVTSLVLPELIVELQATATLAPGGADE
jgi:enamine deaminase RidA (YjgF/YER057c/UK114 family)